MSQKDNPNSAAAANVSVHDNVASWMCPQKCMGIVVLANLLIWMTSSGYKNRWVCANHACIGWTGFCKRWSDWWPSWNKQSIKIRALASSPIVELELPSMEAEGRKVNNRNRWWCTFFHQLPNVRDHRNIGVVSTAAADAPPMASAPGDNPQKFWYNKCDHCYVIMCAILMKCPARPAVNVNAS